MPISGPPVTDRAVRARRGRAPPRARHVNDRRRGRSRSARDAGRTPHAV